MRNLFFIALLAVAVSCNEEDSPTLELKYPSVYAVGYEKTSESNFAATLWKDGVVQYISDGSYDTQANAVHVTGNDVYVVGQEHFSVTAQLWKNNIPQDLSSQPSTANSVYVSDNDVYVGGMEQDMANRRLSATLWRNGIMQFLDHEGFFGTVGSIYVSGNDVYASGVVLGRHGSMMESEAVLWRNGEIQYLQNESSDYACANAVYVSDGNVYVVGYARNAEDKEVAVLWNNGEAQQLSSEGSNAYATAINIEGSDVYVAGYEETAEGKHAAVLWKNGEAQPTAGSYNGYINHVCLHGGNLYAVGYEENAEGKEVAVLWKNGVAQYLSGDKESRAKYVFVK